ncbi:MAG: hypothetical protein HXX16_14655 [Bacteroidales bacterium]|nr:hypothetical protein [Bacteroidales bacterium]
MSGINEKRTTPKERSEFLTINRWDALRTIILTFIQAFLTGIYQLITQGTLLTWESIKPVIMTSVAAVIGYILKNYFTNSNGEFLTIEPNKKKS